MQSYITKQQLIDLGIELDDAEIESLLTHLNESVEERVGADIAASLSYDQLKELMKLQDTATDAEMGDWIASRVSDHEQIVQDTIDIVLGELAEGSQKI